MKESLNLIGGFDESKVSIGESEFSDSMRAAWYDITDIVKRLVGDKTPSILEYIVKIEAEVCDLFDDEEDLLSYVKEEYEDIVKAEYRRLGCFQENKGLRVVNDARMIRLTFANGSVMDVRNSEWGSVLIG